MNTYRKYAEHVQLLGEKLTGTLGFNLTYIKAKSEGLDSYTNYLSSKFFPKTEKISAYTIEERIAITESALQEFATIQHEIDVTEYIDNDLKKFLVKSIEEIRAKAEIAKRATYFEAEKSGYDILFAGSTFEIKKNEKKINSVGLGTEYTMKKNSYLHDIDDLQTKIYGPRISDSEDEKQFIASICASTYQKNKHKLSQQEQTLFSSFIDILKGNITKRIPQDKKKLPSRGNLPMETIMNGTEHIKQHFYPNIQRGQKIEKGKTGYSALFSTKTREYPDKQEDAFNKILTTIGHEDGGHMVRSDNQAKNGMIIAGPGYEDIEEGITKLNEGLLKYSLEEYPLIPNDTFIGVFVGENYNFEDTYHIMKALKKMNTTGTITEEREASLSKLAFTHTQRIKCYYPRDEKGSNRKDVIYFRGEKKLVEYLKSLPNDEERAEFYRKSMSAKVSFEDIFTIDALLEKLGTNKENINQNKLVDKVFNVKLQQGAGAFSKKSNEKGTNNIEDNLLEKDFRFRGMKEYIQDEKKALVDLFTMVNYKKYRGSYLQQEQWDKIKARDQLHRGNIISFPTDQGVVKAKVLSSFLDELHIILQKDGKYVGGKIISIKKKDIDTLGNVRILDNQKE